MRIGDITNILGTRGDRSAHALNHWVWHSPWNCRRIGIVSDVSASDSKAIVAEVSQHGQRSVVSVPPQWQANLRVLDVVEIKTVPFVPLSHPFVERLIGTLRRECLDQTLFWTTADLQAKLSDFQNYFNEYRTHAGLDGRLPTPGGPTSPISFASYRWQKHCRGLYQTPIAA